MRTLSLLSCTTIVALLVACEARSPQANPAPAADNTARNARDTPASVTAEDQGSSEADRTLTQSIRKRVMDLDGLSVNGQNVKIISNGGRVVLRGPVASDAERDRIVAEAEAVAGAANVVDELEVKRG